MVVLVFLILSLIFRATVATALLTIETALVAHSNTSLRMLVPRSRFDCV